MTELIINITYYLISELVPNITIYLISEPVPNITNYLISEPVPNITNYLISEPVPDSLRESFLTYGMSVGNILLFFQFSTVQLISAGQIMYTDQIKSVDQIN